MHLHPLRPIIRKLASRFLDSVLPEQELSFIVQIEDSLIRLRLGNGHEGDVIDQATGSAGRLFEFSSD
jgi:hypothetical protein